MPTAPPYDSTTIEQHVSQPSLPGPQSISHSSSPRSTAERFLDSFFHEGNIKWMLLIGAAIVFGSSLMLVTRHWEHWPSNLKFLTLLGYTGAIYFLAEFSRNRLSLRTTAKVMHGLTLLLLPTCFLALNWLTKASEPQSIAGIVQIAGLMVPAIGLTVFAASRILKGWLHTSQITFLVSYVVLCLAGCMPAITTGWLAAIITAALWLTMTIGVVKVNRHVFWLTEEHRLPRVCGFLPIGLLALQFVILVAFKTVHGLPVEWFGLISVLVASTVFMTARTVANVFIQRTGNLVRPLPWNIVLPIFIGLVLVAIGVCLSFYRFSYVGQTTYAAVPTAGLAAYLMMVAAKDTRHRGFVWAALLLMTIAYQCTPTLATEFISLVKAVAAESIGETRLPLAFYGLTYLPLVLGMAVGSRMLATRKLVEFSQPLKQFATILSLGLLIVSASNTKATFLVSMINVPLFLLLAVLFRDRRYAIPAVIALFAATCTLVPFVQSMGWLEVPNAAIPTSLCVLAVALLISNIPDRWINSIPLPNGSSGSWLVRDDGTSHELCNSTGLVLATLSSVFWATNSLATATSAWAQTEIPQGMILIGIWFVQAIRFRHYVFGLFVWLLACMAIVHSVIALSYASLPQWIDYGVTITAIVCFAARLLIGWLHSHDGTTHLMPTVRASLGIDLQNGSVGCVQRERTVASLIETFVVPLHDLTSLAMLLSCSLLIGPQVMMHHLGLGLITPLAGFAALGWLVAIALTFANRFAVVTVSCAMPLAVSAILISVLPNGNYGREHFHELLPLIWCFAAVATKCLWIRTPESVARLGQKVCDGWLMFIVAASFLSFDWPMRVAALIGIVVLNHSIAQAAEKRRRTVLAIIANIQLLYLAAFFGGVHGWGMPWFAPWTQLPLVIAFLMPSVGASILGFDRRWSWMATHLRDAWAKYLRCLLVIFAVLGFTCHDLTMSGQALFLLGLGLVAAAELLRGVERQKESFIWYSMTAVGVAVVWLVSQGAIVFKGGTIQLVLACLAIVYLVAAHILSKHTKYGVMARPFECVGLSIPTIVTAIAVFSNLTADAAQGIAINSLAMFVASAIYLHRGYTNNNRYFIIAAIAILNVALVLLWRSLGLNDFQWYLVPIGLSVLGLVELLDRELPKGSHDPLRYVGALTILVSPVFEILGGSWLHLISLMVLCVLVVLLSIGLRLRALVYTGSAFLMADLLGMVVRSSIDNPTLLWVCGLGMGVSVIALAAFCENHRERLLARIRLVTAELATWR